jgi:peptide-methionine (S)-S-oxide reductase
MHFPSIEETAMQGKMKRYGKLAALTGSALVIAILAFGTIAIAATRDGVAIPAPIVDEAASVAEKETAIFAGGCFWGVQGVFQRVEGVTNAVSGYAGGEKDTAIYELVGRGTTGHAESVKITFDPKKVSYGHLLQIYFSVAHDPTQLNRQGPDKGPRYRSTIFPTSDEQAHVARAYIDQLEEAKVYEAAIVTTIEPGKMFYPAESYHQDFLTNNPDYPYIAYVDMPKIANLKRLFPSDYRAEPVLVAKVGLGE